MALDSDVACVVSELSMRHFRYISFPFGDVVTLLTPAVEPKIAGSGHTGDAATARPAMPRMRSARSVAERVTAGERVPTQAGNVRVATEASLAAPLPEWQAPQRAAALPRGPAHGENSLLAEVLGVMARQREQSATRLRARP